MDSWPRAREVEKIPPFADRARKAADRLGTLTSLLEMFASTGNRSQAYRILNEAAALLREAADRGVKGKDDPHA